MPGNHAKLILLTLFGELFEGVGLAEVKYLLLGVSKEQVQSTQHNERQRDFLVVTLLKCLHQYVIGNVPKERE